MVPRNSSPTRLQFKHLIRMLQRAVFFGPRIPETAGSPDPPRAAVQQLKPTHPLSKTSRLWVSGTRSRSGPVPAHSPSTHLPVSDGPFCDHLRNGPWLGYAPPPPPRRRGRRQAGRQPHQRCGQQDRGLVCLWQCGPGVLVRTGRRAKLFGISRKKIQHHKP